MIRLKLQLHQQTLFNESTTLCLSFPPNPAVFFNTLEVLSVNMILLS